MKLPDTGDRHERGSPASKLRLYVFILATRPVYE